MKNDNILNLPLNTFSFSEDLMKCLLNANVTSLAELLKFTPHEWHKNFNGFNYHHQQELLNFLKSNNLFHNLKED